MQIVAIMLMNVAQVLGTLIFQKLILIMLDIYSHGHGAIFLSPQVHLSVLLPRPNGRLGTAKKCIWHAIWSANRSLIGRKLDNSSDAQPDSRNCAQGRLAMSFLPWILLGVLVAAGAASSVVLLNHLLEVTKEVHASNSRNTWKHMGHS